MPNPFYRLRFELKERDIQQQELAGRLRRGACYISHRFRSKGSWSLWEAFEMMRIIGEPLEKIALYFPPDDVPPPEKEEL
ncbi:hypothetical protein SAMN02910435_01128 [Ruminococcaceae bacterium D5]|jgi:hypothetical protein|nr:hypothetical protein SAMN02910435_01128 [Ruminococcaceae bacterium D5]